MDNIVSRFTVMSRHSIRIVEWYKNQEDKEVQGQIVIDSLLGEFAFMYNIEDGHIKISDHSYYITVDSLKVSVLKSITINLERLYGDYLVEQHEIGRM